MTRTEIKQTIDEFIVLVEKGSGSTEESEARLKLLMDKLAMAQHFATFKFDNRDYPDAPQKRYKELRKLVADRFPNFGCRRCLGEYRERTSDGRRRHR